MKKDVMSMEGAKKNLVSVGVGSDFVPEVVSVA